MSPIVIVILVLAAILVALVIAYMLFNNREARFTFDIGGQSPRASGGKDTSSDTTFKSRLVGLQIFSGSIIAVLLARLWSMQLVSSDEYAKQAESNRTRTISTRAPRGRILDRNGEELVTNRASLTVVAEADVANDDLEVKLLANLIGMPQMAVKRRIQDSSEGSQSKRVVASDVSRRVVAYIYEHPALFDGVSVEERAVRYYPKGTMAAHVLGYTGTVTQEQLDASKNSTDESQISYESGDTVGQAGIEYQYENVLQGIRGEQTVYVDANGNVVSYSDSVEPESGADIMLTLDANVQKVAEDSLSKWIKEVRSKGNTQCTAGSCVAIDLTNGEVIAMASYPTYSPNIFVGGISSDDWNQLSDEANSYPLMNRAVSGQYASASTIKALSAFAALDYGIATSSSTYVCTGYWTGFGAAYGQYCWNHNGHGRLNLQQGITYSCDTVFYEIGKAFFYSDNPEGLQETYRKWGLGSTEGIDLPGEAKGRVPDADWKWNYFKSSSDADRTWQGGDTTNLVIGQGDLLVTPLQMCCTYGGIGARGDIWRPHLLKSVRRGDNTGSVVDYKPEVARHADESDSNYQLVEAGLEGVIYEESQAVASHFTNMTQKVAGKTGTMERSGEEPSAWFVCYLPVGDPKYAVACQIEHGGYGNTSAIYVVRDIIGQIYNEPDTSSEYENSGAR